jgi:hypothetical protein
MIRQKGNKLLSPPENLLHPVCEVRIAKWRFDNFAAGGFVSLAALLAREAQPAAVRLF